MSLAKNKKTKKEQKKELCTLMYMKQIVKPAATLIVQRILVY